MIIATVNTLTKRFHREKKILMLSSLVVCFSFTILNVFENKKGIIKILVYSSVIACVASVSVRFRSKERGTRV